MPGFLILYNFAFAVTSAGVLAIRKCRAAQERTTFAEAIDHRLAAFGAGVFTGPGLCLGVFHLLGCLFEVLFER